ncbi:hypothetical protein [Cellulomonas triticagri]|uniref:Peptidoglycan binding-like domain-containing protein n=1 Tax=Cellulomonas triticagri TaxID=2483352 RepID=A0A3M2J4J3_9CELL|nr:hypothetical protein [Cellulomonas triticagri]RMI07006.1 hypothetical protein EBM89_14205 [Cellulomonas triticagri]
MSVRRGIISVLVLVLACGASWMAASRLESPDQVAARALAPEPVPVTAALRHGFVHPPVTMQVTAELDRTWSVGSPTEGVVTAVGVAPGDELLAGQVPLRVNGRPVFALPGPFALYRDMRVGDEGDDVAALQSALGAAGFGVGRDREGVFGNGTLQALTRLYRSAGHALPMAEELGTRGGAPGDDRASDGSAGAEAPVPVREVPFLPRAEVLMVDELPAVVQSVGAVGLTVSTEDDLLRLGSGPTALVAELPVGSSGGLGVGASGAFTAADDGPGAAQVIAIDPAPEAGIVRVRLHTPDAVTVGASYVLTFDNPAAEPSARLLAPVSAVVDRGGRSYLYVRSRGGFEEIEVVVQEAVGGLAAIKVVGGVVEPLEGTMVRVGDDGVGPQ